MNRLLLLQSMCVGALGAADDADDVSPPPASAAGTARAATKSGAVNLHRGCPIASSVSGGVRGRGDRSPLSERPLLPFLIARRLAVLCPASQPLSGPAPEIAERQPSRSRICTRPATFRVSNCGCGNVAGPPSPAPSQRRNRGPGQGQTP